MFALEIEDVDIAIFEGDSYEFRGGVQGHDLEGAIRGNSGDYIA